MLVLPLVIFADLRTFRFQHTTTDMLCVYYVRMHSFDMCHQMMDPHYWTRTFAYTFKRFVGAHICV